MLRSLLALALLAATAGCGARPPAAEPPPPPPVAPPPAPEPVGEPPPAAEPREASLVVVNEAGRPITAVYVTPCAEPAWGPDLLGDEAEIAPGATLSFALRGGCWDLRAVRTDGTETVRRTAQILSSNWRWVVR